MLREDSNGNQSPCPSAMPPAQCLHNRLVHPAQFHSTQIVWTGVGFSRRQPFYSRAFNQTSRLLCGSAAFGRCSVRALNQIVGINPMLRIAIATAIFVVSFSLGAKAYDACEKYKFGSQEWWLCISSPGER